jgi:hypothetical protein
MLVKINARSAKDYAANDSRFDSAVRRLATIINQLRENTAHRSTRRLADRLNEMGVTGPNGKPLSYGTMRRILQRMLELGSGDGPSNRSRAASDRDAVPLSPWQSIRLCWAEECPKRYR